MKHIKLFENFVTESDSQFKKRVTEVTKLLKKQNFVGAVYPGEDSIKVFIDAEDTYIMMMWDSSEPGMIMMEDEDGDVSDTIKDNDKEILSFISNFNDSF